MKLILVETKLYYREPVVAFFSIIFPALLIVVLGKASPGFVVADYFPILLALAIATVTVVSLLSLLASYRERGVLRRLAATPVSPTSLIVAQLVVNLGALLLGVLLAYVASVVLFGLGAPGNVPGLLLAFLLGTLGMAMIALFIASVVPTQKASVGWGALAYYPMMFFAGVWTGPATPEVVRRIADFTPLGAASHAMQDAWAGAWPRPLHLIVMAAFAAAFGAAATRLFRWE